MYVSLHICVSFVLLSDVTALQFLANYMMDYGTVLFWLTNEGGVTRGGRGRGKKSWVGGSESKEQGRRERTEKCRGKNEEEGRRGNEGRMRGKGKGVEGIKGFGGWLDRKGERETRGGQQGSR